MPFVPMMSLQAQGTPVSSGASPAPSRASAAFACARACSGARCSHALKGSAAAAARNASASSSAETSRERRSCAVSVMVRGRSRIGPLLEARLYAEEIALTVVRLRRTLNTTLAVVYAEPGQARAALRRIDRRHGPVRGTTAEGRTYDARDPALLLWVQTTLVLTSLRLYEAVLGRLPPLDREAYWQEARPVAALLGIPTYLQPGRLADLVR